MLVQTAENLAAYNMHNLEAYNIHKLSVQLPSGAQQ